MGGENQGSYQQSTAPIAQNAWTALRRTPMPPRSAPMKRAPAKPPGRGRQAPPRRRSRNTGPSARVRKLVLERDGHCCVACGKPVGGACTWWSVQHRKARGQGGGNDPSNLLVLCGSATSPGGCHLRAEQRDPHMHAAGYYLESWQDPETEPVMLHGGQGGVTVWLTADGMYSLTAPERAS